LKQEKCKTQLAIIILNWNSWNDTFECLTSLLESTFTDFKIFLVDNDSSDDSIVQILSWAKEKRGRINVHPYKLSDLHNTTLPNFKDTGNGDDIVLIKSPENMGFARGCNAGIRLAIQTGFKNIMLLNNDTTIDKECLKELMHFLDRHPEYDVITPKINHYLQRDRIWNCGGRLTWTGSRKYYCRDKIDNQKTEDGFRKITFITGCALMARTKIFHNYGLLSEKFFFGEEDYEFSRRMKKHSVHMAAVFPARVYHKIGRSLESITMENPLDKHIIFYLNRFIDLKQFYPRMYWSIWRWFALCYILPMLKLKYHTRIKELLHFGSLILTYSKERDGISSEDFFKLKSS